MVIISTLPGPWTRGIREESSWGPGDDNHNVDVHCPHDVDDGGGRDDQGVRKESSWGQGDGDYPGFVVCNLINSSLFVGFPNCFEKYEIDVCSELGGCEGAGHPKSRRRRRTLDPGGAQR